MSNYHILGPFPDDDRLAAQEWTTWGEQYLKEKLIMPLEVFDAAILDHFSGTLTDIHHQKMQGRKRTRAQNLCDHVKASLTRRDKSFYLDTPSGVRLIGWKENAGYIKGVGTIVEERYVENLLRALTNYMK